MTKNQLLAALTLLLMATLELRAAGLVGPVVEPDAPASCVVARRLAAAGR